MQDDKCVKRAYSIWPLFIEVALVCISMISAFLFFSRHESHANIARLLCALAFSLTTFDAALTLVTCRFLWRIRPDCRLRAPSPDIDGKIPLTLFVIPTLFVDVASVKSSIRKLEQHFISHSSSYLYFGLLSDFADANSEETVADDAVIREAINGIDYLNSVHDDHYGPRFVLLHRPRRWAPLQRVWMGHERKRGKLNDLNEYLATGDGSAFTVLGGPCNAIVGASFVITLDDDNSLMPGGASALIAHMCAPANSPVVDKERNLVVSGHGMLQPLPVDTLPEDRITRYQRLAVSSGSTFDSMEAYYHVCFDEGSFFGKGIYSVETFRTVLKDRLPNDRVLSHDVLEGCYLRCGLVTEVLVAEQVPASLAADVARAHRWIRGDWQVLSWALPKCPSSDFANPLSPLSRLKLFDNARRALGPITLLGFLISGWFILGSQRSILFAILIIRLIPVVVTNLALRLVMNSPQILAFRSAGNYSLGSEIVLGEILLFMTLPVQAWNALTAVVVAHWRTLISKRNMLDWASTKSLGSQTSMGLGGSLKWFAPNFTLAGLYAALATFHSIEVRLQFVVLAILWTSAPMANWLLSNSREGRTLAATAP